VALDPARTVAELEELRELTGDADGAQRVAWTETWERAREWLRGKLADTGVEEEIDAAGNQWFTLRGVSERALVIGGHLDSVPNGGWLDGSLNVVAGAEVLRRIAEEGQPPVTVRLVSWADEEGARFGRSLFGSSAAAGSMRDQDELRALTDRDGIALPDALREHGVELDRALDARSQLEGAVAYLELHIEQGPVLEALDLPLGVVLGTFGVERSRITWRGQAAHAGSTPMDKRRDALAGAAKLALSIRDIAREVGGGAVCTSGGVVTKPGIVTSVVETAEQLLDQRHLDAGSLARMLELARADAERFAAEERIEVEWERIWSIEPILFDETLIDLAEEAIREVSGTSHKLPSGPLHDAAEVARAGIPTVMIFVQSLRGLSHTKLEDTKREHLAQSVEELRCVRRALGRSRPRRLLMTLIETVAEVARKDMHVQMPDLLVAARFVVLPCRDAVASVSLFQRDCDSPRRGVDGAEQRVVDRVDVLDVRVRDHEHVTVICRPPLRRDQRCGLLVAIDDVSCAVDLGVDPAQQPAERTDVVRGSVGPTCHSIGAPRRGTGVAATIEVVVSPKTRKRSRRPLSSSIERRYTVSTKQSSPVTRTHSATSGICSASSGIFGSWRGDGRIRTIACKGKPRARGSISAR
jgi:beta-ureidopropionase / N-carbamoyl-L-amino-acid hydrolase